MKREQWRERQLHNIVTDVKSGMLITLEEEAQEARRKEIFVMRLRADGRTRRTIVHDTIHGKDRTRPDTWIRPSMVGGEITAFRPWPGYNTEPTEDLPRNHPHLTAPHLLSALEKVTHWSELFLDQGRSEGTHRFREINRSPDGRTKDESRSSRPLVEGDP